MGKLPKDVLDHMVRDLEGNDDGPLVKELKERHEGIIAKVREKAVFRYHSGDESISLNGEHLVKGVPAKILRSLLSAHQREGRCEFEYREFKWDFEISAGQKNANFEVRFYRLVVKLEEKCPSIAITKVVRGRFELKSSCMITLEEQ